MRSSRAAVLASNAAALSLSRPKLCLFSAFARTLLAKYVSCWPPACVISYEAYQFLMMENYCSVFPREEQKCQNHFSMTLECNNKARGKSSSNSLACNPFSAHSGHRQISVVQHQHHHLASTKKPSSLSMMYILWQSKTNLLPT